MYISSFLILNNSWKQKIADLWNKTITFLQWFILKPFQVVNLDNNIVIAIVECLFITL